MDEVPNGYAQHNEQYPGPTIGRIAKRNVALERLSMACYQLPADSACRGSVVDGLSARFRMAGSRWNRHAARPPCLFFAP